MRLEAVLYGPSIAILGEKFEALAVIDHLFLLTYIHPDIFDIVRYV